jgi:RNA polymerase sigma-70 factor (ECF subfamily)
MANVVSKFTVIPMTEPDTSNLIAEAKRNPAAFAPLYDRYIQSIYRYIYSRVTNAQEAEDLTAQTFLKALEALPRYRDRGYFAAWLFSIARNQLMDHFRQRKRESNLPIAEGEAIDDPDLIGQVIQSQKVKYLSSLLTDLDDDEQELIRLRYLAELKFSEIAVLLGKKEDAVKKALYRLLARLENQMEAVHE